MPAYILANINVIDPTGIEEYGKLAFPTLVAAGGKILAASSQAEVLEGDCQPGVIVVVEFTTAEKARQWLNSPAYQPARQVRYRSARSSLILVEGG